MNAGHITLTALHFLLSVQHNLTRERETDSGERSVTVSASDVPPTAPSLTRAAHKNLTIQSDRPDLRNYKPCFTMLKFSFLFLGKESR